MKTTLSQEELDLCLALHEATRWDPTVACACCLTDPVCRLRLRREQAETIRATIEQKDPFVGVVDIPLGQVLHMISFGEPPQETLAAA